MRNLKKLLAVIVAVCLLATFTVPAFAEGTLSANTKTCADIGMLVGQGSGVTAEYGATTPTRIQAAVMLLRLTGNLAAAQAFTGTENFADADKATWAKPLMAFLKAHAELGFVGDGTNFNPNATITAQEYYKVLLTALGYAIPADYAYADTLTFAQNTAKLAMAGNVSSFTVDALATATVEALKANVKGGAATLATSLVNAGKLDKTAATTAGLYSDKLTATATQTGAKTITVKFNRALTAAEKTAATFDVKNGLVAYTVTPTWTADNTSVALAYDYNLFAGEYTVTIGGVADAAKATVADEKITKITIANEYLPLNDDVGVTYKVLNQFNEEMSNVTGLTFSAFDATKAKGVIGAGTDATNFKVDLVANGGAKDDTVILTVTHNSGVTATKTIKVSDIAAPKTLAFSAVKPLSGKTRITKGETGLVLPYTFTDQYGNAYTLPEHIADSNVPATTDSEMIGQVFFTTSDASIVDPDTFAVDADGVLTFDATGDGTATISAIVPATGIVATVQIKIEAAAAVKTFTMSNPGKLVAVGDSVTVPYTAVDTFGAPIALKDFGATNQADVTFVSSAATIVNAATGIVFNGKNEVVVTPIKSGTVTLYAYVGGVLQNSITLDVKARAVPTKVVGLKDVPLLFQANAVGNIENKNIKVLDQYNRAIDLGTYSDDAAVPADHDYTVTLAFDGGTGTKVELGDATATPVDYTVANYQFTGASAEKAALMGVAAGSEKFILTLQKDGADVSPASTYKFTAQTIADDDIKGYSIDTIGTMYGVDTNATGAAHAVVPKLLGKDAAGNAVTIDQAIITAFTSSNTAVVAVNGNTDIWALKAGTATIAIWKGGTKLAETTVTAKDEAPYAATAEFDNTTLTLTAGGATGTIVVTVKDQYGVAIAVPAGGWFSSDTAIATVAGGVVTPVATGSATISFVTDTGIVVTCDVTVNP